MTGWKRVIIRTKFQSAPDFFRFHGRSCAAASDFDDPGSSTSERKRKQHRQENARPFFVTAPPRDREQRDTKRKMFGPITQPAHIAHKILRQPALMLGNEILHRIIEVECGRNNDCDNCDADQPIKNDPVLHK